MFTFTKAGKNWNEDACYACEDFAFVLDGETTIVKSNFSQLESDAKWCSSWWAEYLKENLHNKEKSIPEILKEGVGKYTQSFTALANEKQVEDFPSTMGSIVRRNEKDIEFYCIGNSPIIFKTKTNYCFVVCDTLNNVVDDINSAIYLDFANKEKSSLLDAREKYPEYILRGRQKKNSFGGYFTLCKDKNAIEHGIYNHIPADIVDKILILSDGYSQIFDLMKVMSAKDLINSINSLKDAESIYNKLFKLQENDKHCNKYIRFKVRDDATLVCFEV